jgi:uncharacterized protein with beta-barrel porin domain
VISAGLGVLAALASTIQNGFNLSQRAVVADQKRLAYEELVQNIEAVFSELDRLNASARVNDLLRVINAVHARMHSIEAGRLQESVVGERIVANP